MVLKFKMDVKDIKRGDILVANYHPNQYDWEFSRDYIIFIAGGGRTALHSDGAWLSIPTIAYIDLEGKFSRKGSIGFTLKPICAEVSESKLLKPTMSQYVELMEAIAANGYTYNTKTKELKKKNSI